MRTEIFVFAAAVGLIISWLLGFEYGPDLSAAALVVQAFIYFPFGAYFMKVDGQQNVLFSVVSGLFLFMAPISLLIALFGFFKDQIQLGTGVCFLSVLITCTAPLYSKSPLPLRSYYMAQLLRSVAWLFITLTAFVLLPLEMPRF